MKIAYVLDWDIKKKDGVVKKIASKIECWQKNGNEVILYVVSYQTNYEVVDSIFQDYLVFERPQLKFLVLKKIRTFFGRSYAFNQIKKEIQNNPPDIIYYRQSLTYYWRMSTLFSRCLTIMEVNTDDEEEIKLYAGRLARRFYFISKKNIINKIAGIVAVTNEIGKKYKCYGIPVETVTNSIDLTKYNSVEKREHSGCNLIFVITPGQVWQGIDKFIELAELCSDYNFHLVGPSEIKGVHPPKNIFIHGYLSFTELNELYKTMDVGIGTLALFRKNMVEACSLKVREYLAVGLPVILGYFDSDISGKEFALEIDCHNNTISNQIEKIKSFISSWQGKRVPIGDVSPLIDINIKEKKRIRFMHQVYEEAK